MCHLLSPTTPFLGSMISCWPFLLPKGPPSSSGWLGSLGGGWGRESECQPYSWLLLSVVLCRDRALHLCPPTYSGPAIEQSSRAQPDLLLLILFSREQFILWEKLPSPIFLKLIAHLHVNSDNAKGYKKERKTPHPPLDHSD